MTLPTLDMTGWTIDDFEMAYDGLHQVKEATTWLQNQPRAEVRGGYHPGAEFIIILGEDWCGNQIDSLMKRLAEVRFDKPAHNERRVLLLVNYASRHGSASDPLSSIIQMALSQSVRPT